MNSAQLVSSKWYCKTYNNSAVAYMLPERLYECIRTTAPRSCENIVSPMFDALNEGDLLELLGSYGKTRMTGIQSGEGRMLIDSVIWAQYINVTDMQTATQPRRDSNSRLDALRSGSKNSTKFCNIGI